MTSKFLGLSPRHCGLSESLCSDIESLDELLGSVLCEQDGADILRLAQSLFAGAPASGPETLLERMPDLYDPEICKRLARAFTVFFQLINTAEQKEIVRVNRVRPPDPETGFRRESIADAIIRLQKAGTTAEEMQRLIDSIDICPTLTAHPTEARRRAVLDKLQSTAAALADRDQSTNPSRVFGPLDSAGHAEIELKRALTELWQTDELRSTRLTVDDEVRNALYFFDRTIFKVVPWLHDDLRRALKSAYPGGSFTIPTFVTYRSWVGGDRDGNPNVTPVVTWQTVVQHKRVAILSYIDMVAQVRRELTQSIRLVSASAELMGSLELHKKSGLVSPERLARFALEPYNLKLQYVHARLVMNRDQLDILADFHAEGPSFSVKPPAYQDSAEFLGDLEMIERSLRENKAAIAADEGPLAQLITMVRTFGFHLASLDVRQHSDEHEAVVEELIAQAGLIGGGRRYSDLDESAKVKLLTRELSNSRPLSPRDWVGSNRAQSVLQVFEVIRHARQYVSRNSVQAYVISMTHGISDVLEVLLLAKEAGLLRWRSEAGAQPLESVIDVVPLFETIDDLHGCDTLMKQLFANSAYRMHLKARGLFQEIMLGYSDSSKDGGYLAANWALQDTQKRLAATCKQAGVSVRLFHGRGGTVGRGGGRANRAILSQPAGSFNGRIRFTEQGEVISFRYSIAPIAHRHLEQIVNAALIASSKVLPARRPKQSFEAAMTEMAGISRAVYRRLVYDDPQFWEFYSRATPIAHISRLPIASRPVFRPGAQAAAIDDLRAIPWVFAWVQSRYVLPGWYGMGSGLDQFAEKAPSNLNLLREMYRKWDFFRTVVDNAQLELVRAHLPTAEWYAKRVKPASLGKRIHEQIASEHKLTRECILTLTEKSELLEGAKAVRQTVVLRNPATAPLSKLQVALLEEWDKMDETQRQASPAWRDAVLLSITGIAAAMQSTG